MTGFIVNICLQKVFDAGILAHADSLFLKRRINMGKYRYCQSCGFPLKSDKNGGGSEADGSISPKYCSMCYRDGAFLSPPEVDTARKMQDFCIQEMKQDGMNGFIAWLLTRGIPKLERWQ